MKNVLMAGAMLATLSGAALAADLPARLPPPPPPPVPVFTWTGAYFGVNAGYAFDHEGDLRISSTTAANQAVLNSGARPGGRIGLNSDGFTGGGQIGYNFQIPGFGLGFGGPGSGVVVGMEADAAYTDLTRNRSQTVGIRTSTFRSSLDFLGTFRGRLGYAFGQFLVYGTGGFAYGDVDNRVGFYNNNVLTFSGTRQRIETGYTYGGGIEYALPTNSFLNFFRSSAVTVKAEYLHYDLGRSTIQLARTAAGTGNYTARLTNEGDLARIGLNYKFGSY